MNEEERSVVYSAEGQKIVIERGKGIQEVEAKVIDVTDTNNTPAEKTAVAANDLLNAAEEAETRKLAHKKALAMKEQAITDEKVATLERDEAAREQVKAASIAVIKAGEAWKAARKDLPEAKMTLRANTNEMFSVEEAEAFLGKAPYAFDKLFIDRTDLKNLKETFDKHFWLLDNNMQLLNNYFTEKWEEKAVENVEKRSRTFAGTNEIQEYQAERKFAKDLTISALRAVQARIYATNDAKDMIGKQYDFRMELLKATREKLLNTNIFGLTAEESKTLLAKSIGLKQKTVVENDEKKVVDQFDKLDAKKYFRKTGETIEFNF